MQLVDHETNSTGKTEIECTNVTEQAFTGNAPSPYLPSQGGWGTTRLLQGGWDLGTEGSNKPPAANQRVLEVFW